MRTDNGHDYFEQESVAVCAECGSDLARGVCLRCERERQKRNIARTSTALFLRDDLSQQQVADLLTSFHYSNQALQAMEAAR